jgi:mRNA-degrading endonuclease RelE of RelBE toxin-antitoxin system
MSVSVRVTNNFKTALKPLLKKYPSLKNDLLRLEKELLNNPRHGTPLGHGAYKIRLKISSKGKGKSGGARVISLLETTIVGQIDKVGDEIVVNLITIYDKADTASISDKELKELIKDFFKNG